MVEGGVDSASSSVTSGTSFVPAFVCSRVFLTRRAALWKLAVFLSLIFMVLSRPARRLLPGAAGQCLEVAEVVTERTVQSRP